nr:immunoglobulin light chain junction region [Macaca mulatta]MOX78770.1 immunoglobulin light chain junction region [Macaca mulatta]MOX81354.1 immunoglobulin light chain junction region [Macaca mulatta]MOX83052.1 immunoglobulin light chain junction region [Macaca mulatta]MOX83570.1 immunoglobulin light chain junction region [Macaca mulatta]
DYFCAMWHSSAYAAF